MTKSARAVPDTRTMQDIYTPAEWYGDDGWRLPSGKPLAEFALQAGFLAPRLLRAEAPASKPHQRTAQRKSGRP